MVINADLLDCRLHGNHLMICNYAEFMVINTGLLECRLHGNQLDL